MNYFAAARARHTWALLACLLALMLSFTRSAHAKERVEANCIDESHSCPVVLVNIRGEVDAGTDADCEEEDSGGCPVDLSDIDVEPDAPPSADAGVAPDAPATVHLVFFWGVGCPHCEQAKPYLDQLLLDYPTLRIERVEVRQDRAGAKRFALEMKRLGISAASVPAFVVGARVEVGFDPDVTPQALRTHVADALMGKTEVTVAPRFVRLPLVGNVDPSAVSLPAFTVLVGLVDGINPCAMWVLLVLLSILVHVKSRRRIALFGGTFVVMSGVVYFLFMTAWVNLFALVGFSRVITIVLGTIVLVMGVINLKEVIWFKQGVSLTIPETAKPKLYRRMRSISGAASLPAAFLGIAALAFFVNLIELGCTLGLPAIYTRVLTLHEGLSPLGRYGYLALYNVAYVVPLALIVAAYALTLHRMTLSKRGAKALKAVSGTLLVLFGLLFILAPDVLS